MNKFPLLSRFIIFVVGPFSLLTSVILFYFISSLPGKMNNVDVKGLESVVNITIDQHGVPYIFAQTDQDVFFAMGYLHAQDRLWQLEIQRRVAKGRLSEVFGVTSLKQDTLMRTLGIYQAAEQSWPRLSNEAKRSLLAYADGINAWLDQHRQLSPEFTMLGVTPERWTVYDSLAWIKVFSLNLSGNFRSEIANYLATQSLTKKELTTFFSNHSMPAQNSITNVSSTLNGQLMAMGYAYQSLENQLGLGGYFVGSNAWVVSGRLTADNSGLLANDPHLTLQMPSLWYPVTQRGGTLQSAGMSLVGLPLVVFGRNSNIAWGGTNMMADVQDLYFEQVDPTNPTLYQANGSSELFKSRTENIKVKANFPAVLREELKPVQITIRSTRHGPVISDGVDMPGQAITLRWTALDSGDTTYESFLRLNYAQDWTTFRQALHSYISPPLNMLYADKRGNIGFQGIGKIPIRTTGNGSLPSPGWNDTYEWRGYIPFDEMPQSYNPESGYIVSANNKNVASNYPYFISNEWAPPGRAQRISNLIEQQLREKGVIAAEDFERMQVDLLSTSANSMLKIINAVRPETPMQREALQYFREWKGEMVPGSKAATIFNAWMSHLKLALFSDRLQVTGNRREQAGYFNEIVSSVSIDNLVEIVSSGDGVWCVNKSDPILPQCGTLLIQSLDAALDELNKLAGADMREWGWGQVHHKSYIHPPFSHVNFLKSIFGRQVESGGGSDTVNVANSVFEKSEGYKQSFGSSFRQIIKLSPTNSLHFFMNSTGQSGNIFSSHYADMIQPFANGEYVLMENGSGTNPPESVIVLRPHGKPTVRENSK